MITLARDARQLTQSELAALLGFTQGRLSRIENGTLPVSEDVLLALSRTLGYPPRHFTRADEYKHLPFTFRRKRIKLSNSVERAMAARVNLLRMYVSDLMNSVDMVEPKFDPVDLRASGMTPRDVAADVRMRWGVPRGPITNLTKLLEDSGVLILHWDFGTDRVDGLSIYDIDLSPPLVFINRSMPSDRQRFTLAHEFGHVLMHHNLQTVPADDVEAEANQFASEFLMPTNDVKSQIGVRPTLQTFATLKAHWRVSMGALIERAASLNRISEWQHASLWRQMAAHGYKLREPLQVPGERPTLFEELVRFHIQDLGYSWPHLCERVLGIKHEEFTAQIFGGLHAIHLARANPGQPEGAVQEDV